MGYIDDTLYCENLQRFFQGSHLICTFSIGNNVKSPLKSVPLYGKEYMVTYQYYDINGWVIE